MTPKFDNYIQQCLISEDESRRKFLKTLGKGAAVAGAVGGAAYLARCSDRTISANVKQQGHFISSTLFNYLITQENHRAKGRDISCMWFPHKSYEGGAETLGYGHKFANSQEQRQWYKMYPRGMTQEQIEQLLINDIAKHADSARQYVDSVHGAGVWKRLPQDSKDMLTDMSFNPGITKFPTFTKAVVTNDWHTAKREYHRHSGGKSLTRRNNAFFKVFLKNK